MNGVSGAGMKKRDSLSAADRLRRTVGALFKNAVFEKVVQLVDTIF